jgi:two-component system chemotaxis sensor kinase CheA
MIHIDDDRFQKVFIEEVSELLENLNHKFLELEKYPEDNDIINEIFRLTHSIKGESAIVGFMNISTLSHKMEDIFQRIRDGKLNVTTALINTLFKAYDKLIELVSAIQNKMNESDVDISTELKLLNDVLHVETIEIKTEEQKTKIEKPAVNVDFTDFEKSKIEDGLEKGDSLYKVVFNIDKTCEMKYPRAFLVYNNYSSTNTVIKTNPDVLTEADDSKYLQVEIYLLSNQNEEKLKKIADVDQVYNVTVSKISFNVLKEIGIDVSGAPGYTSELLLTSEEILEGEKIEKEWEKELQRQAKNINETKEDIGIEKEEISEKLEKARKLEQSTIRKQTIRVETDRLDNLMNLVGELIINYSRFIQLKNQIGEKTNLQLLRAEIDDATNELERISDQMQMGMMHVRMVPIGTVFSKFPRMVRDLANSLNKKVNLLIEGEDTEIDRSVVELITEPLTHLIRNSIDHGIESAEERERKGKPKEGLINLKAYQQGSNIYIEVYDDGRGISIEKIKEKAIEKKLATYESLNEMSNDEIINFIFEPGFSTKESITGLSGRGVGMDVVRNQISKIRGSININTKFGFGTRMTIILPLTLTIIEALLVNLDKHIFAIPINVIKETIKIRKDEIKDFDEYKVYNLRDETIAVLFLNELVGVKKETQNDEIYLVVMFYENRKIGVVVDDLIGSQDIVIKALDESLKQLEGISGATVLGDGSIAIILDINNLVKARKKELNKAIKSIKVVNQKVKSIDKIYDELNKPSKNINELYDNLNGKKEELYRIEEGNKKQIIDSDIKDFSKKADENFKKKTNDSVGLLQKAIRYKKENKKTNEVEIDFDLDL